LFRVLSVSQHKRSCSERAWSVVLRRPRWMPPPRRRRSQRDQWSTGRREHSPNRRQGVDRGRPPPRRAHPRQNPAVLRARMATERADARARPLRPTLLPRLSSSERTVPTVPTASVLQLRPTESGLLVRLTAMVPSVDRPNRRAMAVMAAMDHEDPLRPRATRMLKRSIRVRRPSENERRGRAWSGWKPAASHCPRPRRSSLTSSEWLRMMPNSWFSVSPSQDSSAGCVARPGCKPESVRSLPRQSEAVGSDQTAIAVVEIDPGMAVRQGPRQRMVAAAADHEAGPPLTVRSPRPEIERSPKVHRT
jgi:hypothetical protein